MAEVYINGLMGGTTMEIGSITKWMELVCSSGLTDGSMKESIATTRKRDSAFSHGQTAESTMVNGTKANSMARESTRHRKER